VSIWQLGVDVLVALGAAVAILQYFGVTPTALHLGIVMPVSRKWKLALMLVLMA
jgi:hypothetical protein